MQIFLVGFMGSGKTYWAERWARRSGLDWFDLDREVEAKAGMSVAEVFAEKGEAWFRARETECLRSFAGRGDLILSCGGGAPCHDGNMEWMNANGLTVYMKTDPDILFHRLRAELDRRPLLQGMDDAALKAFIAQKGEEREPVYLQAHRVLPETDRMDDTILTLMDTRK